ncbi:MAG: arginine N-succinyltransferase [Actinomycetota bacterium]
MIANHPSNPGPGPDVVLRPVTEHDGPALMALLAPHRHELIGMLSLPSDEADAVDRCRASARMLAELGAATFDLAPGTSRSLLLVLEQREGGGSAADVGAGVLGVTGFSCKHDVANFAVEIVTSPEGRGLSLQGAKQPWTCTELNATFLGPRARGRGLGRLLSRGRLLLLSLLTGRIPGTLVSHLRGPFDRGASAPFWDSFGAQVVPQWATSEAAERGLARQPSRLEDLVGHSISVEPALLDVVGSVNRASLPAYHMLVAEGMRPNGMYDPVDGGPTLVGDVDTLTTARDRRPVAVGSSAADEQHPLLLARAPAERFLAWLGGGRVGSHGLTVAAEETAWLALTDDDDVVGAPLGQASTAGGVR